MPRDHRPSFQFYPGDWLKDPDLRRCSPAARGVWIDVLCLMFECEPRGLLTTNGKPWSVEEVSKILAGASALLEVSLRELIDKGVCDLDPDTGAIMSRRMVRDEALRQERALSGRKGGLAKQTASKPPTKSEAKPQAKRKQKGSSSSSSSSSSSESKDIPPTPLPASLDTEECRTAWAKWLKHLSQKRTKPTPSAIEAQIEEMEKWGHDRAVAALNHSRRGSYQGLFEPSGGQSSGTRKGRRRPSAKDRGEYDEPLGIEDCILPADGDS